MGNNMWTYRIDHDLLYLKNTHGTITIEDAKNQSDGIRQLILDHGIRRIAIDNRQLRGTWASGSNEVWVDLMAFMAERVDKVATLCENVLNENQLNRLSRQAGTYDRIQAFTDECLAKQFLGIPEAE